MAAYTLGTLGTLLEAIKETRHFRPQGTRKTTRNEDKGRKKIEALQGSVVKSIIAEVVCVCVCETSLSRSRAKL